GIDRVPPPGVGGSGGSQSGNGNDKTEEDATEHDEPSQAAQSGWHLRNMIRPVRRIKPGLVHIRAYLAAPRSSENRRALTPSSSHP
ncbi:MAG: hypothetical protein WB420_07685, partial [Bradyrhizobium sp.]